MSFVLPFAKQMPQLDFHFYKEKKILYASKQTSYMLRLFQGTIVKRRYHIK